eukprot:93050_1
MGSVTSCFGSPRSTLVPKENRCDDMDRKFKVVGILGEGASCEVRECIQISTNKAIALKRMAKTKMNHNLFEKEVSILKELNHLNIIHFIDCYMDSDNYYIATSLCSGGELFESIVKATKFSEKIASKLIQQMLLSLQHCHERSIAHRDLKPENFVFESKSIESKLVLIDFGCARKVVTNAEYTDIVGTPYYLAPEYLRGKSRNGATLFAADVWAVGVICFILVTGQPPFNGKNNNRIFLNIVKQSVKFPKHAKLSDTLKDFILTLLNKDPLKRPSASKALLHPFVSNETNLSDQSLSKEVLGLLSQFKHESKLKKKLAEVVVHYAPKKDMDKLREMFESVDTDGDGELTVAELSQVLMHGMKYYKPQALKQARVIMEKCDTNGDGKLSFQEFSHVHAAMQLSSDEMLIHTCFSVMDENGDGHIEIQELQDALKLSQAEAKDVFLEADLNGDGVISFDEFKIAMSGGLQSKKISKASLFSGIGGDLAKNIQLDLDTNERSSFSKHASSQPSTKSDSAATDDSDPNQPQSVLNAIVPVDGVDNQIVS